MQSMNTGVSVRERVLFLACADPCYCCLGLSPGDRTTLLNDTEVQVDFKSHQWFGATVRTHNDTILVRHFPGH